MQFALRFDFRNPAFAGVSTADQYAAALDMVEWGDRRGCVVVSLSEHHGSDDGYLPSPIPMLAAMAARTTNVRFAVTALVAPFYDPLRLAEDFLVLDNLSRGRVDLVVAAGYVPDEFEMYGMSLTDRPQRVTEVVTTLKAALTGEAFDYRGRRVHLTPGPVQPGGPPIVLGGGSPGAARRAARIADGFFPTDPTLWPVYCEELARLGKPEPGPSPLTGLSGLVALAEDPDEGWRQLGPYFLHHTNTYGAWQAASDVDTPYRVVPDLETLRGTGMYSILTPAELVDRLKRSPTMIVNFTPLCGGIPPELAWSSLRLLEHEVIPAL